MTYIVRASIDPEGRLQGMVTDAQTGRKERFGDAAQLGALITTMARQQPASQTDLDQPQHIPGDKQ